MRLWRSERLEVQLPLRGVVPPLPYAVAVHLGNDHAIHLHLERCAGEVGRAVGDLDRRHLGGELAGLLRLDRLLMRR